MDPERDDELVAHYEQLRRDALEQSLKHMSASGPGMVLFLREGMVAWMRACSQCTQASRSHEVSAATRSESVPYDLRTQIAVVLAGMVLDLNQRSTT